MQERPFCLPKFVADFMQIRVVLAVQVFVSKFCRKCKKLQHVLQKMQFWVIYEMGYALTFCSVCGMVSL